MGRRWKSRAGETGASQENPPTSGIRSARFPGVNPAGIEPGSLWCEANSLATASPLPHHGEMHQVTNTVQNAVRAVQGAKCQDYLGPQKCSLHGDQPIANIFSMHSAVCRCGKCTVRELLMMLARVDNSPHSCVYTAPSYRGLVAMYLGSRYRSGVATQAPSMQGWRHFLRGATAGYLTSRRRVLKHRTCATTWLAHPCRTANGRRIFASVFTNLPVWGAESAGRWAVVGNSRKDGATVPEILVSLVFGSSTDPYDAAIERFCFQFPKFPLQSASNSLCQFYANAVLEELHLNPNTTTPPFSLDFISPSSVLNVVEWRDLGSSYRREPVCNGGGKREIPEKTHRPAASFGTIPTCENPGVARSAIEAGSPVWEAISLSAHPPRPPLALNSLWVGTCKIRHKTGGRQNTLYNYNYDAMLKCITSFVSLGRWMAGRRSYGDFVDLSLQLVSSNLSAGAREEPITSLQSASRAEVMGLSTAGRAAWPGTNRLDYMCVCILPFARNVAHRNHQSRPATDLLKNSQCDKRIEYLPHRRHRGMNPRPSDYKSATLYSSYKCRTSQLMCIYIYRMLQNCMTILRGNIPHICLQPPVVQSVDAPPIRSAGGSGFESRLVKRASLTALLASVYVPAAVVRRRGGCCLRRPVDVIFSST
ncbi:hypothetical protein PR048_023700 [Dryococelus australis]|uniref:Uncharacterized protein n=1 Tax=Dryococelus australis TaxID=614101 RepID=A0ABQ9GV09_9NEOP|nr:hypothetical protein PR048_023700 [Dryococelus australis]